MKLNGKKFGRGNRKEQRKRYKKRKKTVDYFEEEFDLIDGNFTHYPVGFCKFYDGFLSEGLEEVHKCIEKGCYRFMSMEQWKQELLKVMEDKKL